MTIRRPWWRSTIRVRLTLLYAGAFFLAGAVLVALIYLYLGQVLSHQLTVRDTTAVHDAVGAEFQRAREETLNTMLVASLVLLGVVGVAAAAFGWLLAGRALHPLHQITATARRVADRSLHERIALAGPDDEIKDLADTFDEMLERLDRAFEGQQRFVANASHELRTPLTINRTLLEVALAKPDVDESLRQLGDTLLAVNERHERLIDGLLTLASSEQRITDATGVDLADVARHVIAESAAAAEKVGVELRSDLRPAPVAGDAVLLERLIQNLVDNGIRYNIGEDGWVMVRTNVVDHRAHLSVENTGAVVPPYAVPALFEPFRRQPSTERLADSADGSFSRGAGLGLSIVRSVARAHGGEAHATPRTDGGLIVEIDLPLDSRLDAEASRAR
ncbi:MAG TPA: HAMP domain-containing sensor histidine kinase [Jatrophihabitantaceae bacterium]|nr:HAMP domain-containing sensor histidine kinase [Jatrophihabitantaceae bacterium]